MNTQVNRLTDSWLKFTYAKYSQGYQFTKQTQTDTTKYYLTNCYAKDTVEHCASFP